MHELIVLTERGQAAAAGRTLADVVHAAVDGGARTVLLREKDLPRADRRGLALALQQVLAPVDGTLLVAGDAALAEEVGAAGVHLDARQQEPTSGAGVVGRSCHTLPELRSAQAAGVDYVTFSPVWATASKPGYGPALGLDGLADGCAAVPDLPVYALGGVEPTRVAGCRAAGAAGVAVMGGVMRAEDPTKMVRSLLEEWS